MELNRTQHPPLAQLFSAGGAARNVSWRQIVSDVIGEPQTFLDKGNDAFGTALLAGHAIGAIDIKEMAKSNLNSAITTYPRLAYQEIYQKRYQRFIELSRLDNKIIGSQ